MQQASNEKSNLTIKLSIIIVTWNNQNDISNCIDSIYENAPDCSFEIIVADNTSKDDTVKIIREKYPSITLLELDDNLGFARGNNIAIQNSSGEYVLLLNPDTIVLPYALERSIQHLDKVLEVAVVGGELLEEDGSLQAAYFNFPNLQNQLLFILGLGKKSFSYWKKQVYKREPKIRNVEWVSGTFMMVRRRFIEKVGLLDERLFFYGEEVDWCYRLKNYGGGNIHFLSDVQIIHLRGQSSIQESSTKIYKTSLNLAVQSLRGRLIFFWTHLSGLKAFIYSIMVFGYGLSNLCLALLLISFHRKASRMRWCLGQKTLALFYPSVWKAYHKSAILIPSLDSFKNTKKP